MIVLRKVRKDALSLKREWKDPKRQEVYEVDLGRWACEIPVEGAMILDNVAGSQKIRRSINFSQGVA